MPKTRTHRIKLVLRSGLDDDEFSRVCDETRRAGFELEARQPLRRFGILLGATTDDHVPDLLDIDGVDEVESDEAERKIPR